MAWLFDHWPLILLAWILLSFPVGVAVGFVANPSRVKRSSGQRAARSSSVATCAASAVSNRPTVVMGEGPGGSSSRT
jgi:hypothetical protein